jgi:hypothetical protein
VLLELTGLPLPIEPALQQHRGSRTVDALSCFSAIHPLLAQPSLRLDSGEPLVDQLHACGSALSERFGKAPRTASRQAFFAIQLARQTHQEDRDAVRLGQPRELPDDPARVSPVQMWARMGHQAELISDGQPNTDFSEVHGCSPHTGRV